MRTFVKNQTIADLMSETSGAVRADELSGIVIQGILDKKARNVVSLNLSGIPNAITTYFIICHGTSRTQVAAIADSAIEHVRKQTGENPWHTEGYENAEWILIDYVDVVLHVFQKSVRDFYQLEELWSDAEVVTFDSEEKQLNFNFEKRT